MKASEFSFRVFVEDTDCMGIVYHANYLCFFERARTEMIRNAGLSLTTLASYHTHFAITEVDLRYFYPARLDDLLTITSIIDNKTACSVLFNQVMYNETGEILCKALIKVVCIDDAMKPKRLPQIFGESKRIKLTP